jgi:hypothetical protein
MLSALRGCDGKPKEDVSKKFTRKLRKTILYSADTSGASSFMSGEPTQDDLDAFTSNLDHYPMHWLMHFAHACEIVGYRHPVNTHAEYWQSVYFSIVEALHLNAETEEEMDERLKTTDYEEGS